MSDVIDKVVITLFGKEHVIDFIEKKIEAVDYVGIFFSILTAFLLGLFVSPLLNTFTGKPQAPLGANRKVWDRMTKRGEGGSFVGFLERYISLVAFWAEDYKIIGGWLAFKPEFRTEESL